MGSSRPKPAKKAATKTPAKDASKKLRKGERPSSPVSTRSSSKKKKHEPGKYIYSKATFTVEDDDESYSDQSHSSTDSSTEDTPQKKKPETVKLTELSEEHKVLVLTIANSLKSYYLRSPLCSKVKEQKFWEAVLRKFKREYERPLKDTRDVKYVVGNVSYTHYRAVRDAQEKGEDLPQAPVGDLGRACEDWSWTRLARELQQKVYDANLGFRRVLGLDLLRQASPNSVVVARHKQELPDMVLTTDVRKAFYERIEWQTSRQTGTDRAYITDDDDDDGGRPMDSPSVRAFSRRHTQTPSAEQLPGQIRIIEHGDPPSSPFRQGFAAHRWGTLEAQTQTPPATSSPRSDSDHTLPQSPSAGRRSHHGAVRGAEPPRAPRAMGGQNGNERRGAPQQRPGATVHQGRKTPAPRTADSRDADRSSATATVTNRSASSRVTFQKSPSVHGGGDYNESPPRRTQRKRGHDQDFGYGDGYVADTSPNGNGNKRLRTGAETLPRSHTPARVTDSNRVPLGRDGSNNAGSNSVNRQQTLSSSRANGNRPQTLSAGRGSEGRGRSIYKPTSHPLQQDQNQRHQIRSPVPNPGRTPAPGRQADTRREAPRTHGPVDRDRQGRNGNGQQRTERDRSRAPGDSAPSRRYDGARGGDSSDDDDPAIRHMEEKMKKMRKYQEDQEREFQSWKNEMRQRKEMERERSRGGRSEPRRSTGRHTIFPE